MPRRAAAPLLLLLLARALAAAAGGRAVVQVAPNPWASGALQPAEELAVGVGGAAYLLRRAQYPGDAVARLQLADVPQVREGGNRKEEEEKGGG